MWKHTTSEQEGAESFDEKGVGGGKGEQQRGY
jgi:hypothetical protein